MIVLINPYQQQLVSRRGKIYNRVWPPLSLASCAALLEHQGHAVKLIDANALRLPPERLASELAGCGKAFISSSDLDRWQCPTLDLTPFLNTVEEVRKHIGEVYIMGAHGTVKPAEILGLTHARAVVVGEPEFTVAEICKGMPLREIKGIAFLEDGKIVRTESPKPTDLDCLPAPAFHLLPMQCYHYEVLGSRFTLLEASRGCASHCRFCLMQMYGRGVRRKSVEKLAAEIDLAVHGFGVRTAYFMDLEFTVLRRQVEELCTHLVKKKYDLRWTCQTRFDLIDADLLRQMKLAGCTLIHFGVEAGTDDLLKAVNKGITTEQIRRGMQLVKQAHLDAACFFILGFPGADGHEMAETIRFAKELNPTYALFHQATPYPGTMLYDDLLRMHPEIVSETLFPEACVQGEELKKLKATIRSAYLQYYARPGYIGARIARGDLRSLAGQIKLLWGYLW